MKREYLSLRSGTIEQVNDLSSDGWAVHTYVHHDVAPYEDHPNGDFYWEFLMMRETQDSDISSKDDYTAGWNEAIAKAMYEIGQAGRTNQSMGVPDVMGLLNSMIKELR